MSEAIKFEDYKEYLSPVFAKQTDLVMKSGEGCYLTDISPTFTNFPSAS